MNCPFWESDDKVAVRQESHYHEIDGNGDIHSMKRHRKQHKKENSRRRILWIYLLSISQHHAIFRECRTYRQSQGYILNFPLESAQEPHSTVNVALVITLDSSAFPATGSFPAVPCRVWAAPREQGFWDVCLLWRSMGRIYLDWEDKQYLQHFRVSKDTLWHLCQTYGKHFK